MCGDPVRLVATAENMPANTAAQGKGTITTSANKLVLTESSTGQSTFNFPQATDWNVKDVVFSGTPPPLQHALKGEASALGQTVQTPPTAPLVVKRIPDKDLELVSTAITSGIYGWTSVFQIGFKDNKFTTHLKMHYTKAWQGKYIIKQSSVVFVKKIGTAWKSWDASAQSWTGPYNNQTVRDMIFLKVGNVFKDRDSSQHEWPESFPDSASFDTVKATWLSRIHSTWDGKFKLKRKNCPSSNPDNCCAWPIDVKAEWNEASGDKDVFLIWTQQWNGNDDGRSNAKDWYIGDTDIGTAPHEFGHLLGAYDEYTGGALAPAGTIDDNTVMGLNMTLTPKTRHLDNWCTLVTSKIRTWTGHSSWEFEVKDV
jgi:hypothetical protein